QIVSDRPRTIEALWHWHPDCEVVVEEGNTYTANSRGNLQIVPGGDQEWDIQIVEGQEEPELQGWYSEEYNKFTTNPVAVYSTELEGSATFVWLLHPSEGPVEDASVEILTSDDDKLKVLVE